MSDQRLVSELTSSDIGQKIRVRDYAGVPHVGVLVGVELYRHPRRCVLHFEDGWGEVFVNGDQPFEEATP